MELEANPQATKSALALPNGTGSVEIWWELEGLPELGYKRPIDNGGASGSEEDSPLKDQSGCEVLGRHTQSQYKCRPFDFWLS